MHWIPVLGQVEDEIVNCFKKGGGGGFCLPYSSYKTAQVMEEESAQTVQLSLFESIIPFVIALEDRLKKRN